MRILIYTALLLISCSPEPVLTEAEVMTVIERFDAGWQNKKPELVDSVLSRNYTYFTQSGNTFDRNSLIATAGSQTYTLQTMQREEVTIHLDGNTAVVNTIWSGKGFYHGQEFNDRQRCSITIVKHKKQVRILAEHCTPIKSMNKEL
ncbi:MAG: hypothetical protein RL447_616 [Bacteroidota bacterium]|jgi:hypothetical protein